MNSGPGYDVPGRDWSFPANQVQNLEVVWEQIEVGPHGIVESMQMLRETSKAALDSSKGSPSTLRRSLARHII